MSEIVDFTVNAGFDGIELWSVHAKALIERQQHVKLRQLMQTSGIPVSMLSGYLNMSSTHESTVGSFSQLLDMAEKFETDKIRIFAGSRGSSRATDADWEEWTQRLSVIGHMAGKAGVKVLIETHPNTYADTIASTLRLIAEINNPHIAINLDFIHLWETGVMPLESYEALAAWTYHFHLKNIGSRHLIHAFHSENVFHPTGSREGIVRLQDGELDYVPVIAKLISHAKDNSHCSLEWFGEQPCRILAEEIGWLRQIESRSKAAIPY